MLSVLASMADDPESVGNMVGVVFWMAICVIGIIKCFSIARRKATSSLCVHSLTLALGVYVGAQLLVLGKELLGHNPYKLLILAGLGVCICIVAIVGLALAIVGLVTYRRSFSNDGTRREYVQGKKQAGWAIALNFIFILLFFIGVFGALVGRGTKIRAQRQVAFSQSRNEYVFEEKNFRLSLGKDEGWIKMDAKTLSPDASVMLLNGKTQVYASVIAEKPGVELGLKVEQLIEIAQANLKARCPEARFSETKPSAINAVEGRRFSVDASLGGMDIAYQFWCAEKNGYCYQIVVWTAQHAKGVLDEQADLVFKSFSLIDSTRRCFANAGGAFNRRSSDIFGYEVDLSGTDWFAWDNVQETDRMADCGGIHPGGTRFSITPVLLPEPGVSIEEIHNVFLELYGFTEPLLDGVVKKSAVGDLQGLSYAYSNTENHCREQVVLSSNCAWLVSVWCSVGQEKQLDVEARTVFDAIRFRADEVHSQSLKKLSDDRMAVQGLILNRIGLNRFSAEHYLESIRWFGFGHACDSTNAVYFGNILAGMNNAGNYEEGLALLETVTPELRADSAVKRWEASLLAMSGNVAKADAIYAGLFRLGYRNDDDFYEWTQLRANNGLWDGMDDIFSEYMAAEPSVALLVHQLDLYYAKGDFKKVAALARRFLSKQGFSVDVAYWLIDACQELGFYNEALEMSNQVIEKGYATVSAYQEKAYSEYKLKWYRQAKATLNAALKLNPANETTKEWIGLVSAELGEGDNSCLVNAIKPVELPFAFTNSFSALPDAGFGMDFGAYYSRYLVLWNYEKENELKRTDVYHIKVLDEAGISSFSSLEYSFNPVSQNIFVNELLVRNEQGDIVTRGAMKDYYVLDDHSDGSISEDKRLVIPIPGLQPDCSIEAVVTREYSAVPDGFYFTQHFLASGFPVLHSGVFLGGDTNSVVYEIFNGVAELRDPEGVLFMGPSPYIYKSEPLQVAVEQFVPGVVLGSKELSWAESGTAYLKKISERLRDDETLRKQASELIKGCKTDAEKYKAIVDWVRTAFTYKPLEFGRSANMPDYAFDTISYRYGDCKDLSVLLKVMLGAVGVNSELALVDASGDIYEDIPGIDQFDHMIVYLPCIRGGLFVDPTDQQADAFLAVPQGLRMSKALVLFADQPKLMEIPDYHADSSSCRVERTVSVVQEKSLAISDRVAFEGYYAQWMRGALKNQSKVNQVEWFQRGMADYFHGLEVKSVDVMNLTDRSKSLIVKLSYVLREAVSASESGEMELEVPPIWVRYYISSQKVLDRKSPFTISYPFLIESTVKVAPSKGFRVLPSSGVEVSDKTAYCEWKADGAGHFSCRLKAGDFPADDYAEYVNVTSKGVHAAQFKVRISPEE